MIGTPPPAELARLRTEHPGRLHLHEVPGGYVAFLGTRSPPFDDVRARQALNLALDRQAAVDALGGPGTAVPSCQVLPPGVSGYVRYCPYTRDPDASGRWKGPDLERARRLVAGTRHRGMLVTYWTFNLKEDVALARVAMRALRALGYRTRLRYLVDGEPPALPGVAYQIVGQGGTLSYPAASQRLGPFLSCRGWRPRGPGDIPILGGFCDRRMVDAVAAALESQTVAPDEARRQWAAADRRFVDEAAVLPFVTTAAVAVTGPRVGNYAWSPAVGVLLDQMWVR
jgi:peptide/nickel transport system substrate-binding protein